MGVAILALVLASDPLDGVAARADWQAQPIEERNFIRYLSLGAVPPDRRAEATAALKFVVASTSREVLLDAIVPELVPGTESLYRINLRSLQWDWRDYLKVVQRSPYSTNSNPLVVRGDWLVWELSDGTKSDSQQRLLYGKRIPKTRDDFLRFWNIDPAAQKGLEFGLIPKTSLVNKARDGVRWIDHTYATGAEHWGTRDVIEVKDGRDPLDSPTGDFKHDAEEHLILIPKTSARHGSRGVLMATLLSDGNGKVVQEAPVEALEDYSGFKGGGLLVNPGSCYACHSRGAQRPAGNAIRSVIEEGVLLYAKDEETGLEIERFHLGGIDKELTRWEEDWATAIHAVNGLEPESNALAYVSTINRYDADLPLQQAAFELGSTAEEFSLALGYASANKVIVGVRLARLAHGDTIVRTAWEDNYLEAVELLRVWKGRQ